MGVINTTKNIKSEKKEVLIAKELIPEGNEGRSSVNILGVLQANGIESTKAPWPEYDGQVHEKVQRRRQLSEQRGRRRG